MGVFRLSNMPIKQGLRCRWVGCYPVFGHKIIERGPTSKSDTGNSYEEHQDLSMSDRGLCPVNGFSRGSFPARRQWVVINGTIRTPADHMPNIKSVRLSDSNGRSTCGMQKCRQNTPYFFDMADSPPPRGKPEALKPTGPRFFDNDMDLLVVVARG